MINEDDAKNPEGFNMLKMLAEEGDLEAQTSLVFMYFTGDGVNQNLDKSLGWCERILKNPEGEGQNLNAIHSTMGEIYMKQKKYDDALIKFTLAYENETALKEGNQHLKDICQFNIAGIYWDQDINLDQCFGIYKSIVERKFPKVSNINSIDAHRMLSYCYLKGRGTVVNYEKVIELSKNVVTLYGNEKKQPPPETLGHVFNNIGYSYEMLQNYTKAVDFYFLALNSSSNYEFAGLNLAFCFEHGL